MDVETEGKKTALYDRHVALGARIVPFGGYLMPLQYSGQIAEHRAVREMAGLFDLSHMGEFRLSGEDAGKAVDRLLTNRVADAPVGSATYSPMCRDDGGIVDDLIAYRLTDAYLLVVNASNIAKDAAWVKGNLLPGVTFEDHSDRTALLAVQGPNAERIVAPLADVDLVSLPVSHAVVGSVGGIEALISRTGYTGEDGFELYVEAAEAPALWDRLLEAGSPWGMLPIGLAARDTLRFEMGYCLYGNDIDETTTPLEAGLGWTVKLDKDEFMGKDALVKQKKTGVPRKLVGLRPEEDRAIPRKGFRVFSGETMVGRVTSGTFAPSLERGLGIALVDAAHAGPQARLTVEMRGRKVDAAVARLPFYTGGSRKAPGTSTSS